MKNVESTRDTDRSHLLGNREPNAEVEEKSEVQGPGEDEFKEEMGKTTNVP